VSSLCVLVILGVPIAAQAPLEFDVASIKVHPPDPGGNFSSSMRTLPNGQVVMTNMTIRTIIGRAYPSRGSNQVIGLPDWAGDQHYDVVVKANRAVSREEQEQMWRTLLADRMKLQAHYESREEASFDLVFARADKRLGPKMKPSTCTPSPPPAAGSAPLPPPTTGPPTGAEVMARCAGFLWTGNNIFAPRSTIGQIASFLRSGAGRIVVDKTGLEGFYDVEFSYSTPQLATSDTATAANPTDAAEFFTAVQEQLGFKLEPSKTQVEVLVIDHLERPTEN
jgi:uncharacterized protein (TIGR03435 family)